MAFQKTLTTVWNGITLATNVTDANTFSRSIPRTFDVALITKVTFATSTAEDVTVNCYASNDNSDFTTSPVETVTFSASDAASLILIKELRLKVNDLLYLRFTLDNPDDANTATVTGKLSESVI